MELEEQVRRYKEIMRQVEELEKERKAISASIMERMKGGKLLLVADYVVRKIQKFTYAVSIEEARKLNATKMEERIDKDKLKSLYAAGSEVKGLSHFHYLQVSISKDALPPPEELGS